MCYMQNINAPDKWGRRAIYYAIVSADLHQVQDLLQQGCDLTLKNKIPRLRTSESPIQTAIRIKNLEIFKVLISTLDYTDYLGSLLKAPCSFFREFLKKTQIYSFKGDEMTFCSYARVEHYQICHAQNICIDLQQALKYTLIYRKYGCFLYLLKKVKYAEQVDYVYSSSLEKVTLFAMAAVQGFMKGVAALLAKGANLHGLITDPSQELMTYLMYVCSNSHFNQESIYVQTQILSIVQFLIRQGIDVNYQNNTGLTALMLARKAGNTKIIDLLISKGADPHLTDMSGNTAFDYSDSESRNSSRNGFAIDSNCAAVIIS